MVNISDFRTVQHNSMHQSLSAASPSVDGDDHSSCRESDPEESSDNEERLGGEGGGDGIEEYEYEEVEEEIEVEEEVEVEVEVSEEEEEEEWEALEVSIPADLKPDDVKNDMESMEPGSDSIEERPEIRQESNSLAEEITPNSNCSSVPNELMTERPEFYANVVECKHIKSGKLSSPEEKIPKSNSSNIANELMTKQPELYANGIEYNSPESGKDSRSAADRKSDEDNSTRESPKQCGEPLCNVTTYTGNGQFGASGTPNPSSIIGEEFAVATDKKDCSFEKFKDDRDSEEEVKSMDISSEGDEDKLTSRSDASGRTMPPLFHDRLINENKRRALICDFFSKGWCIKGSSCRFLHISDEIPHTDQQPDKDATSVNLTIEDCSRKGFESTTEKTNVTGFPKFMAYPKDATCPQVSTRGDRPWQDGESKLLYQLENRNDTRKLLTLKDGCGLSSLSKASLSKDEQRANLKRLVAEYGSHPSSNAKFHSSLALNSMPPEHVSSSSGSGIMTSNSHSHFPFFNCMDNLRPNMGQSMLDSCLENSRSSMLPSSLISPWTGLSYSLSSTSNIGSIDAQKLSRSDRETHPSRLTSLQHVAPSFFSTVPETSPLTALSSDPNRSAKKAATISSNNWEPSVPFLPSLLIKCTETSPLGSKYDPLLDCVDTPNIRGRAFIFSFLSPGTSIPIRSLQPQYRNSSVSKIPIPEDTRDKNSADRYHDIVLDKSEHTISGRKVSDAVQSKDIPNDIDHSTRPLIDGSREKDLKVEKVGENSEMEVDQKTEISERKEAKVLRHFRAALIDFVKELLKPSWHEGHMKKVVHKTIVKKAVEKVLTSMQPHQIPNTVELIKQYLSISRPKIKKLVEGYARKYGKT